MNRAEKRAGRAGGTSQTLARDAAIHEAGHAVARLLTAQDFGLPTEICVARIDVGLVNEQANSGVGIHQETQATCFGLMFSLEINNFIRDYFPDGVDGYGRASPRERKVAFKTARQNGIAVDTWLRGRHLIDVFGAVAEAKFSRKGVVEIWNSPVAVGDYREAVFAATMAGLDTNAITERLSAALDRATNLLEEPEIWRAVQDVADILPSHGSVAGRKVWPAAGFSDTRLS